MLLQLHKGSNDGFSFKSTHALPVYVAYFHIDFSLSHELLPHSNWLGTLMCDTTISLHYIYSLLQCPHTFSSSHTSLVHIYPVKQLFHICTSSVLLYTFSPSHIYFAHYHCRQHFYQNLLKIDYPHISSIFYKAIEITFYLHTLLPWIVSMQNC